MDGFGIHLHRRARCVDCAMAGESFADDVAGFLVGNHIVKLEPHPLQHRRPGMDPHGVVVIQGPEIVDVHLDDGVDIAAFFDRLIRVGGIAHERGPAEFKIAQVIGVVDHLGAVRVRVEGAGFAAVPDDIAGTVPDILRVVVQRDRNKGFRFHFTPPERPRSSWFRRSRRRWTGRCRRNAVGLHWAPRPRRQTRGRGDG